VHDGVGHEDDLALERNDDDGLAAVEVVEIGEIADVGAVGGAAEDEDAVEAVPLHQPAQALDPLLVLPFGEREDPPAQAVLVAVGHAAPPVGHRRGHAGRAPEMRITLRLCT
jgi:hypothetical protein